MSTTTPADGASTAASTTVPATLCEAFQASAARAGDAPALRTPKDQTVISWSEYAERVRAIAGGLAAHGLERGDTVAIMMSNRPEAHIVDVAALHLGATPFSIYNTSSPEQLDYILEHSEAKVIVTEPQFLDRVLDARERVDTLTWVFSADGATARATGLDELAAAGDPAFDFEAAWRAARPEDVASMIYTSGTTGPPKGVQLTHDNLIWDTTTWLELAGIGEGGHFMSHLPMAHLADRVCGHYVGVITGGCVTCVSDPKQALAAVAELKPTEWLGVPRVWEKLKVALEGKFDAEPDPDRRAGIKRAVEAGKERARLIQASTPVPDALEQEWAEADRQIFSSLRASLGFTDEALLISGAAQLSVDVLEFFDALGIVISEGYGMSECSCITAINYPERRYGTVGKPLPGVELKLAEDGEVLVRGRLVTPGYRNDPEKTAEAIDPDGWFRTGDVGEIDADGFLRIVDRKKELIINAAGKNMSPANIESVLKGGSALIGVPLAIGDGRAYNTALIVLEPEASAAFAREHELPDASPAALAEDPLVQAEVAAGIERANERLSRVEQIKKFRIVGEEWLPGGDELTPTLKPKRRPIAAKYAELIESMY